MAIDKVTSASITTDAVGPTQLNQASNYAFTGTVTGAGKEISEIDKDSLNSLISEAEQKIVDDKITDKEKYLLSYKIDTLKNINQ